MAPGSSKPPDILPHHTSTETDLANALNQCAHLQATLDTINKYLDKIDDTPILAPHPYPDTSPANTSEADTRARVKGLVEAYIDLRREKNEIVRRYTADRIKWDQFKQWLRGRKSEKQHEWSRRVERKENADEDDDFQENSNDITAVELEEPLAPERPHTPKKQPLSPSGLNADSLTSPPTSFALSNNVLQSAAVEAKTRQGGPPRSPLFKITARRLAMEAKRVEHKSKESATPTKSKGKSRGTPLHEKPRSLSKTSKTNASFKYDEVVRNKRERKQLHGGDCDCCREYYKAVGPLPPRAQPPLWRTPPSSPVKRRHVASSSKLSPGAARFDSDDDFEVEEIAAHKKQISRHRHRWEPPKTPPGYWDIAFPDTQQVEEINRLADEMHARKRAHVDSEPSGSKGRKRKR